MKTGDLVRILRAGTTFQKNYVGTILPITSVVVWNKDMCYHIRIGASSCFFKREDLELVYESD